MKLSLDQGLDQLEAWLNRLQAPATPPPQPVHEQNEVKKTSETDHMRSRNLDSFLYRKDFRQRYDATVEGTSPRAAQAREVEKKFNAYNQDSFVAFKRSPVELNPSELKQRAFIRV
jgi:hypothetical protein